MALFAENWILDTFCLLTALSTVLFAYIKWSLTYWQRKNVETLPTKFPFGNATDIFMQRKSFADVFHEVYKTLKSKNLRHGGFYFFVRPIYVPVDPEIIKHIMQKDFHHFVNHGVYFNEKDDPLSAHLFALEDTKWKNLRAKLTPTFTSGRLKAMFQTLVDCTKELIVLMDKSSNGTSIDIKDILGRFTTDIIGSCAFGIECNSLKDPDAEFRKHGKKFLETDFVEAMKIFFVIAFPRRLLNKLGVKSVKPDVANFFTNVVKETVHYREKNNVHRKDFMHLLLQLKNRGKLYDDDKIVSEEGTAEVSLTMNELAAQAFIFFLAGFETSSTTMTFALYELAANQQIQENLRHEIKQVLAKHNNEITYEAIMEMEYMDKVINETLRKYPPLGVLNRMCNKDYEVPQSSVMIKKGTAVFIPVKGIHLDPEYYPEPHVFDPERFNEDSKNSRPAFTYMPFGEGPRICIGLRFGVMQSKVGLVAVLRDYNVTLSDKTKYPVEMEPTSFITTAKGGIWLDVKKLSK